MKEFVGILIAGNFYTFGAYKITDSKGLLCFLAEPRGIGATRCGRTLEELQKILNKDVQMMNLIARERSAR